MSRKDISTIYLRHFVSNSLYKIQQTVHAVTLYIICKAFSNAWEEQMYWHWATQSYMIHSLNFNARANKWRLWMYIWQNIINDSICLGCKSFPRKKNGSRIIYLYTSVGEIFVATINNPLRHKISLWLRWKVQIYEYNKEHFEACLKRVFVFIRESACENIHI